MAQQPNYGALSDASVEQAKIDRARKYAELMQQQSQEPLQGQMAGGWYVAPSWTQGAAKLAQALGGAYVEKKADEDTKKLAERLKTERDQADARVMAAASGSPNLATDPTRLATALPQWATDAQPDLVPKQPTRDEIRQNVLAAAMAHPEMRGPALGAFLQQMTANPESQFAKIDPSKFTAESVAKFAQTNRHSDLVPRDRLDFQNIGGQVVGLNPFSGAKQTSIDTSMRPGEAARLDWDKYQFGNLSANQRLQGGIDLAKLANSGIETNYNTGQGVGSPMFSGLPQNAPMQAPQGGNGFVQTPPPAQVPRMSTPPINPLQQPRPMGFAPNAMTPNGQPLGGNLPPKVVNDIAADSLKQQNQMNNKRTFNMQGINGALDEAENILTGQSTGKLPTSSGVGNMVDSVAGFFGASPSGAAEADKLRSIGGALVAKMPRMEGPQSDKDVQLYREMAGQVGDASIPIQRRLAALQTVRQLYAKYEGGGQPERRSEPRSASNRVVVDF